MNIGERIKNRRKEIGLSVDDVSDKLGKNRATIYRYESSDIENLPITILEPLSKILQTTPDYLMGWIDEKEQQQNVSEKEKILLSYYNQLNDLGKEKLIENAEDLTHNTKYNNVVELSSTTIEDEYEFETIAAHADDLTEEENNENLAMIKAFMAKKKKEHK